MLPDDAARRAVVIALAAPNNRLRVHQGLLLVCLYDLGYPEGMDRDSWWAAHSQLFRREYDPKVAASLVCDWLENVERIYAGPESPSAVWTQLRAARYQQQGTWGAHVDFAEAFWQIKFGQDEPDVEARRLADAIIWWPERQT